MATYGSHATFTAAMARVIARGGQPPTIPHPLPDDEWADDRWLQRRAAASGASVPPRRPRRPEAPLLRARR